MWPHWASVALDPVFYDPTSQRRRGIAMLSMSPGEKLIAFMLADLMEHLKVRSEIEPAVVKRLLSGNDEWALANIYSGLLGEEKPRSEAVIKETGAILDMFRGLDYALGRLTAEEMAGLDLDRFKFEGFDGNNDPHYHIAHTMIDDLGWFDERKPLLNSHSRASLPRYRRMLSKYEAEVDKAGISSLTLDQLKAIVA
jgi:uncharacterized protein YfbU (UPF0304 family)